MFAIIPVLVAPSFSLATKRIAQNETADDNTVKFGIMVTLKIPQIPYSFCDSEFATMRVKVMPVMRVISLEAKIMNPE
jgi:hypothetical protein